MPGAGGGVAQWMAYAHAVQSAKDSKERGGFGKGDIRGVLGPGAANNSKEGGDLIPTMAFGVPGSGAMAILARRVFDHGHHARPGHVDQASRRDLLDGLDAGHRQHHHGHALPRRFSINWRKLTYMRGGLIIPFILLLVFVGSYTANGQIADLIVTLIFGVLGYLMVLFGWPRPPLVLGFVLGKARRNLLVHFDGPLWLQLARASDRHGFDRV